MTELLAADLLSFPPSSSSGPDQDKRSDVVASEDPSRDVSTSRGRGWITVWILGSEAEDDERRET